MTVMARFSGLRVGLQEGQKIEIEYQTRLNSEIVNSEHAPRPPTPSKLYRMRTCGPKCTIRYIGGHEKRTL
jgi:hypothetical protein